MNNFDSQLVFIDKIDKFPRNITVSESQIDTIKQKEKKRETGNLASQLNFKFDSQFVLTSNTDTDDRLVNGLVGRVTKYVKFNDDSAGLVTRQLDVKSSNIFGYQ